MPWTEVDPDVFDTAQRQLRVAWAAIEDAIDVLIDAVASGGTADDTEFEIRDQCSRLEVAKQLVDQARRWLPSEERPR